MVQRGKEYWELVLESHAEMFPEFSIQDHGSEEVTSRRSSFMAVGDKGVISDPSLPAGGDDGGARESSVLCVGSVR